MQASQPMLVLKDADRGYVTANLVPKKRSDAFAMKSMSRDVGRIVGHKGIILRSDQEPAIKDLKEKYERAAPINVAIEETPVGDSKSAGGIENAMKQIQGMIRTYKLAVESRIGGAIARRPRTHTVAS